MKFRYSACAALLLSGFLFAQQPTKPSSPAPVVRNVILMIGDGMGNSEITAARNYYYGAAGRLEMDALPHTGTATTYSLLENDPSKINYVTDSAAGATAWTTGHKTSNGRLATEAQTNRPLKTLLELAQERGYRTGNITTAELTDATPAALGSHISQRGCQGPDDMEPCHAERKSSGGLGSIAEQLLDHKIDVLMGGGLSRFRGRIQGGEFAGQTVLEQAAAQGYTVVSNAQEMNQLQPGQRVLGLFANGTMSLEWSGDPAVPFPGSGPQKCAESRRPESEPSLANMLQKALALLDTRATGPGFFLQVEGAQIDKASHQARPCEQIGETVAFDQAVKLAIDYASSRPDTLVIVTADHGHTVQIVPTISATDISHPTGLLSTLTTADNSPMTLSYATGNICCSRNFQMEHTGVQVRLAATGPHSEEVEGTHDMTDVNRIIARSLGLE